MEVDYKRQIDQIRNRVSELEKEYVKAELTATFITDKVNTLKTLLREKYSVETVEGAKAKLVELRTKLQEEIDSINKIL